MIIELILVNDNVSFVDLEISEDVAHVLIQIAPTSNVDHVCNRTCLIRRVIVHGSSCHSYY